MATKDFGQEAPAPYYSEQSQQQEGKEQDTLSSDLSTTSPIFMLLECFSLF